MQLAPKADGAGATGIVLRRFRRSCALMNGASAALSGAAAGLGGRPRAGRARTLAQRRHLDLDVASLRGPGAGRTGAAGPAVDQDLPGWSAGTDEPPGGARRRRSYAMACRTRWTRSTTLTRWRRRRRGRGSSRKPENCSGVLASRAWSPAPATRSALERADVGEPTRRGCAGGCRRGARATWSSSLWSTTPAMRCDPGRT